MIPVHHPLPAVLVFFAKQQRIARRFSRHSRGNDAPTPIPRCWSCSASQMTTGVLPLPPAVRFPTTATGTGARRAFLQPQPIAGRITRSPGHEPRAAAKSPYGRLTGPDARNHSPNCILCSWAYAAVFQQSAWLPRSTMRPSSTTTISSAFVRWWTRRWAITSEVRFSAVRQGRLE